MTALASLANLSRGTVIAAQNARDPQRALARFERKFIPEPNSGCWLWLAGIDAYGYGQFTWQYHQEHAHRHAYRFYVGEFPAELHVLHRCDNRLCVNPGHLFLGTHRVNMADMRTKGRHSNQNTHRTECRRGHKFTPDNTRIWNGRRICRACARLSMRVIRGKKA